MPKGTLVIRAAEQLGIQIPRFCDHPLLAPAGACRQCLVEVWAPGRDGNLAKMPKPQASCTLEATPGHAGQDAAHVARGRQGPARRDGAAAHQPPARLPGLRQGRRVPAAEPGDEQRPRRAPGSSTSSARSPSRSPSRRRSCWTASAASCASAARGSPRRSRATCSSTCRSAAPTSRSARSTPTCSASTARRPLGAAAEDTSGRPFASYFSGNTVQICPVGALTSAAYRFRSRPFDLVSTPGIARARLAGVGHPHRPPPRRRAAPAGGRGPGGQPGVDHRQGPLRVHVADRAGPHHHAARAQRRRRARAGQLGRGARRRRGRPAGRAAPDDPRDTAIGVAVLPGGRLTLEDAYAYGKFARVALGTNDVDGRARPHSAEEEAFLGHHVAGRTLEVTFADLDRAPAVLLVGLEPEEEAGIAFLRLRDAVVSTARRACSRSPRSRAAASQRLSGTLLPGGARHRGRGARRHRHRPRAGDAADAARRRRRPHPGRRAAGRRARRLLGGRAARAAHRRPAGVDPAPRRASARAVEAGLLPVAAAGRPPGRGLRRTRRPRRGLGRRAPARRSRAARTARDPRRRARGTARRRSSSAVSSRPTCPTRRSPARRSTA